MFIDKKEEEKNGYNPDEEVMKTGGDWLWNGINQHFGNYLITVLAIQKIICIVLP